MISSPLCFLKSFFKNLAFETPLSFFCILPLASLSWPVYNRTDVTLSDAGLPAALGSSCDSPSPGSGGNTLELALTPLASALHSVHQPELPALSDILRI